MLAVSVGSAMVTPAAIRLRAKNLEREKQQKFFFLLEFSHAGAPRRGAGRPQQCKAPG